MTSGWRRVKSDATYFLFQLFFSLSIALARNFPSDNCSHTKTLKYTLSVQVILAISLNAAAKILERSISQGDQSVQKKLLVQ